MTNTSVTGQGTPPEILAAGTVPNGKRTVLVVEDEGSLRLVVRQQLGDLGYNVLEAENADRAMDILAGGEKIDLLFTDIVMPGKTNGMELARIALKRWPFLRIVLTSGSVEPGTEPSLGGLRLLGKPYLKRELESLLQDVFAAPDVT